jgi:amidase
MKENQLLDNKRLSVSDQPPYDPLHAFVRDNHIALKGASEGPLSGLVFAAKDVFMVKGSTYSNGHPLWLKTHGPDPYTASSILKLLDAGADMVGKTVCDELCYSISGENWNYGAPLNPHDIRRFTGGSSSGSGAATAGGLVDFATGSDCLGSVRVPASYNGLFGMRPTYKRVDNDGEAPYCESMDVLGYVAADPEVFKRVSQVILGEDGERTVFKQLYIATDGFDSVDEDVKEALMPAVEFLKSKFDAVKEVKIAPEGLENWVEIFRFVQGYEVYESYGGWIDKYNPRLSRGPKERLDWAKTITREQYLKGQKQRELIIEYFRNFLPEDAVLVLPTAASIAPLRTETLENLNRTRAQSSNLLCISPLTQTPQVTVPMIKQEGVPLGLTLISSEDTDLQLATFAADVASEFKE